MKRRACLAAATLLATTTVLSACGGGDGGAGPGDANGIKLVDVTTEALGGEVAGGRSASDADGFNLGIGTGAAIADLDGDGRLDLVLVRDDDPRSDARGGPVIVYRNQGGLRFAADHQLDALFAGVAAHGVAASDLEGDGDVDLFIAAEGRDHLLVNDGRGGFSETAAAAGVTGPDDLGTSALFADVNGDGVDDLVVSSLQPSMATQVWNRLYLGRGDGSFEDATVGSGFDLPGATWTAAAADLDRDGRLDLYLANDQFFHDATDRYLVLDRIDAAGRPHYRDVAATVGVAERRASMGIAMRDVDGDGDDDLYVTNWGPSALYLAEGASYRRAEKAFGIDQHLVPNFGGDFEYVSWGARFLDLDRDCALELMVVHGAASIPVDEAAHRQLDDYLRQPAFGAPFALVSAEVGLPTRPRVSGQPLTGRGLISGDLDGDGDEDLVVTPFAESFRIYRNDSAPDGGVVRLRLTGTVSGPAAAGAVVRVRAGGKLQRVVAYAGGDVHSQGDGVLSVGLGAAALESIEITWPSGLRQEVQRQPGADGVTRVREPEWLQVTPRLPAPGAAAELHVDAVDGSGALLGAAGAARRVECVRSDGVPAPVVDRGDGSYAAVLTHPGVAGVVTLTVSIDGRVLGPRPRVWFR